MRDVASMTGLSSTGQSLAATASSGMKQRGVVAAKRRRRGSPAVSATGTGASYPPPVGLSGSLSSCPSSPCPGFEARRGLQRGDLVLGSPLPLSGLVYPRVPWVSTTSAGIGTGNLGARGAHLGSRPSALAGGISVDCSSTRLAFGGGCRTCRLLASPFHPLMLTWAGHLAPRALSAPPA